MSQDNFPHTTAAWTIAALAALLLTGPLAAAVPSPYVASQDDKLIPDPVDPGDRFAREIAVDDAHVILGNALGDQGGQVFVYEQTNDDPRLEATLTGPTEDANLGEDLAVDGSTLVVGAGSADTDGKTASGAAYVYEETTDGAWQRIATLTSPAPEALEGFGRAVAIEGDTIAVSEPEDNPDGYDSVGAIHVFEATGDGYALVDTLTPPSDPDNERLGIDLALENGTLFAGAPEDETGTGTGAVYVYEEDGSNWVQAARLVPPPGSGAEAFGLVLDVDQDTLVVGAPGPQVSICCNPLTTGPEGQAFAYALEDGAWTYETELAPHAGTPGSSIGFSVAVDGGLAYAAAPDAPRGSQAGTVAVFEQTEQGWQNTGQILAGDAEDGDRLGNALAAHAGTLFAAAPGQDDAGHDAGAVYVFSNADASSIGEPLAPGSCTQPTESLEVCQADGDLPPEHVDARIAQQGLGQAHATYTEETWFGWTYRNLVVEAKPATPGPTEGTVLRTVATCWSSPEDELACNDTDAVVEVDDEPDAWGRMASIEAGCWGLGGPSQPRFCGAVWTEAGVDAQGIDGRAWVDCGTGFFSTCPQRATAGYTGETPAGYQQVFVNGGTSGAGFCVRGDLVPVGCSPVPP